ncbi:MAG: FliA/WhiG family RNA polymerase sigma factor [Planctomycetota bacterium]|jgi:RNA polymerase sigma factor for flagellar operon FliA|nr:FliA/WhiG family RNA polymerase sigma factor [Planctomycetota bacterium]
MKVETQKLWDEFRRTGDHELRNRLVEKYLYIVKYVSDRLGQKLPRSIPDEDIRSAASFGLIRAVENFDHKRGTRFETYCATRVKGAILDELRARDWVPRMIRNNTSRMNVVREELKRKLGREPTPGEMAPPLEVSREKIETMIRESNFVSMFSFSRCEEEAQRGDAEERTLIYEDKNSETPFERIFLKDLTDHIMKSLTHREKMVVLLYYVEDLSMKEIGKILNISESRVSQIRTTTLAKLRTRVDEVRTLLER